MNSIKHRLIGLLTIILSVSIIGTSMYYKSTILLFVGIIALVVSVFLAILLPSLYVFKEDRILDEEELQKKGLHIVVCRNCRKKNVLEDIYCVYCGEDLKDDTKISDEV